MRPLKAQHLLSLVASLGLAACGGDDETSVDAPIIDALVIPDCTVTCTTPDAAVADAAPDAPPAPDAAPDAPPAPDAAVSSVEFISAGDCAQLTTSATITTSGMTFSPNTATITAGQIIQFTPIGSHNLANQAGAPATALFSTGGLGTAGCLRFTAAGTFPFRCTAHGSMGMTGTITVN